MAGFFPPPFANEGSHLGLQNDGFYSTLQMVERSIIVNADTLLTMQDEEDYKDSSASVTVGDITGSSAECQFARHPEQCPNGHTCRRRHGPFRDPVCKYWLRGLCKKMNSCEFLHQYDLGRMPRCQFFTDGCQEKDCVFKHVLKEEATRECPWYLRGFCRNGPDCKLRHTPRPVLCPDYAAGFCVNGPGCEYGHPNWEELEREEERRRSANRSMGKRDGGRGRGGRGGRGGFRGGRGGRGAGGARGGFRAQPY